MAEKEAWPGAGIDFKFEDLGAEPSEQVTHEVKRIFAHVEGLASNELKLKWIDRYFIEYEYQDTGPFDPKGKSFWVAEHDGALSLRERLDKLKTRTKKIMELEAADKQAEETTAAPARNSEHTHARQALAIYHLLNALGVDFGGRGKKKAAAEMIEFLTGKNFQNSKTALAVAADEGAAKDDDVQFILPFFENLGLKEIAGDIREILEK